MVPPAVMWMLVYKSHWLVRYIYHIVKLGPLSGNLAIFSGAPSCVVYCSTKMAANEQEIDVFLRTATKMSQWKLVLKRLEPGEFLISTQLCPADNMAGIKLRSQVRVAIVNVTAINVNISNRAPRVRKIFNNLRSRQREEPHHLCQKQRSCWFLDDSLRSY
jgi:hypothetical protein